jgi:hypothetical protein
MIEIQEAYKKRSIRYIELWEVDGWKFKVYGIAYKGEYPKKESINLAKSITKNQIREIHVNSKIYNVGFIVVHEAREANFILVDYWTGENMLCNHAYLSSFEKQAQIEYLTPTGLTACVWELRVICFEREAWIKSILANPKGPDINQYLSMYINEDV